MKKVSLLAASVAIALTGCGGSDGDSGSTSPSGVTITGFDGYFNQAVVFDDKNNNGILDINSDIILGLTDSEGKLSLSDDEFDSITSLALQTLTPGGAKQAALIASNPQLFAGKYTIDMDHPTQAMEHEVVFRTLPGGDVISPLTDLVVLEAGANPTEDAITAAKKTVNVSLGLPEDSEDAFGDVIANDDAELHKTAQILTESKANDPTGYESNPTSVAEEATKVVQDNPGKVNDENFKPIVDGDTNTAPVLNSKLVVNKDVKKNLDSLVDALELETHEGLDITLPLSLEGEALFNDTDNNDIEINATFTTKMQETITGVALSAVNGGDLVITGTPSEVRDTYIITLSADDKDASENVVGAATTTLEIGIKLENAAPEADKEVKAEVQEWFDERELTQGIKAVGYIHIDGLFTDSDEDSITYAGVTSVPGLTVFIDDQSQEGGGVSFELIGSPEYAFAAGETVTISGFDGINTTYETFTLPEIAEQSLEADPEEVTELQEYINELLADLKVGEEIDVHSIEIDELFETDSVAGVLEYYVGIEDDQEGYTSIPGVKVAIENDVYLQFSGTPTAATKNGYFNIAAGVNVDTDEEIVSEMVRFSIPVVEPADDVTPPPADSHPLEGKTWYNLETGSSDGSGQRGASRVWCDSIKFEDGIIYGNVRSLENKTSCSEADTQEDEATYRIEGDKLIATFTWSEDGETVVEEHALVATSSEIADGAMTVVTTFENIEDEDSGIESERYTYFADKSDAESRITTKSDDGPMKRFGEMYIPAAEQDSDNYSMQLGRVSYSISDDGDANEPFDADIYFDVDDMNVTCDMIDKTYSNFMMTSDSGVTTDNWGCFDNIENGVRYATVNFFPESGQLVVGEVYSLIGYVENYDGETEAVKFNIEWTGEANED